MNYNRFGLPRLAFSKSRNDIFYISFVIARRIADSPKQSKHHPSLRESQRDSKQSTKNLEKM